MSQGRCAAGSLKNVLRAFQYREARFRDLALMADTLGQQGVLQFVPPAALEQQEAQRAQGLAAAQDAVQNTPIPTQLAGYINGRWEIFRNHRNTSAGWSERLLIALRTFNGQYDATKLNEIRKFGGSEVYLRLVAQKCRAATSLLRDIYLGADRPWSIKPPASPDPPPEIMQAINQLLTHEQQMVQQQTGKAPPTDSETNRRLLLMQAALDKAKKTASDQAKLSEDKVEDILRDGGFYQAFAEFLVQLCIFPFACIVGPEVKILPELSWPDGGGPPSVNRVPKLTWRSPSPFDLWWTPGVSDIAQAEIIEKIRMTRAELNDLLDLPGYDQQAIREVLQHYGQGGYYDNWDTTDAERAVLENKENPAWNRSGMITGMLYNGPVQGQMLAQYGIQVDDPLRDYYIQAWKIGPYIIKAHLAPSPRQRHPYFITSFEKVPNTPIGNGLTDILVDIQEIVNGTVRALVNNVSIASGPQVVVRDDRLSPDETGEDMYPWKRWHVRSDPLSSTTEEPITFFMPTSNAGEMMQVFDKFVGMADDVSAIPKYIGGEAGSGGAGRTASGLAMLMGNASKILQTVAANVDRDVMEPALTQLADLILLTDETGILTGEEKISVQGVQVAVQRETIRQRQVEYLQATNNPIDNHIMGLKGRGSVLRAVAATIGLDGEIIVPPDQQLDQMQKTQQQQQQQGPLTEQVNQAVTKGVAAGVQRITTELTAAQLGGTEGMPMGMPTHIGTPGGQQGAPGSAPVPGAHLGPQQAGGQQGGMQKAANRAQGTQQGPLAAGGGPQVANTLSNQPGPGAKPISPGPA